MSSAGNVVIEASDVIYYSPLDEAAFFDWLDRIPCVESYRGERTTLHITVTLGAADEQGLRELVALYHRYDIDMRELRVFDSDLVGPWFSEPGRWWHDKVFQ